MGQPASGASMLVGRRGVVVGSVAGAMLPAESRAQSPRDTIMVGLVNYPPNIKPLENTGSSQGAVKLAIWRSLLSYDAEGRLQPELAASWTQESATAHLFTLRDDAVFHNGAPVTSEDVAFTIGLIRDPKQTAFLRADFDVVDRVDVLGPKALRIVLKQPKIGRAHV